METVPTVVAISVLAIASIALLAWTPGIISIGLAVIAAASWCMWLERHPSG